MPSIAIVGPGAVGGAVAAHLTRAYADSVRIAARTPFETLELQTADGTVRSTPEVLADSTSASPVDWVLVATKAYDAEATEAWLRAFVGPETTVAILQNGVEHIQRFAPLVPAEQLLPVVVNLPAHRSAPGRVVQRGTAELTVPASSAGTRFAELFADTSVLVQTTDDFLTAAWRKLAFNATGAITATTLVSRLDMTQPWIERLVRQIVEEAVAVGRAEGAALVEDLTDEVVSQLSRSLSALPNSMHADRLAGRRMEIDARNAAIVRIGRRHGIPTPVNGAFVDLLSAVDASVV